MFGVLNRNSKIIRSIWVVFLLIAASAAKAQSDPASRYRGAGGASRGKDTVMKHRSGAEDSITINFRYLDSSRFKILDSSIYDFSKKVLSRRHTLTWGTLATHPETSFFLLGSRADGITAFMPMTFSCLRLKKLVFIILLGLIPSWVICLGARLNK